MLDTLDQTGTKKANKKPKKAVTVQGRGSELTDEKLIKKRAAKKLLTQKIIKPMIEKAELKKNLAMEKMLWAAYYCQHSQITAEGKIFIHYCKTRLCMVCQGIRKAAIINRYYPELRKWEDPQFVTLTVKAIPAYKLKKWIKDGMVRGFKKIETRCKKRFQRGKGLKLMGIKSLECNFNPVKRTYNPHYHIIVPNKKIADLLVKEWLLLWTKEHAAPWCQKVRPVKSLEKDLIETIKYGAKIFTDPDMRKGLQKKSSPKIYTSALYNVLEAMQGVRIFDRFGFNLPKKESEISNLTQVNDYESWEYDLKKMDWINTESNEGLTQYLPETKFLHLLVTRIDAINE